MAQRIKKLTPIAATVALSLGLAGCGSDNDNNISVTPAQNYTATDSASFNTEISGKAIKGSLAKAVVSVTTLDDAGESVPVAFRLAASTEAESYSGSGLSQAEADSEAAAEILANNPEMVLTDETGAYSIFLEDDFSGPLYITITASEEGDDSLVRCDSYTGCGQYSQTYTPELPNDGDLNIEFGEWFKADVELSVVKFIAASDADSGSALGDEGVTANYTANAGVLTSIISKLLLGSSVDSSAISAATIKTVIQILGPDAALTLAPVLADISTSGGTDLSAPDGDEELSATNLLMAQFSAAVQGMTGQSIAELINTLSTGVTSGSVVGSDDSAVAALASALQQAVTHTVNIFVAVLSGDQTAINAALTAAYMANNPDASAADIAAYISQAQASIESAITQAVASGSATRESLLAAAEEAQTSLETLGCTTDCEVGETFYGELAAKVSSAIAASEVTLTSIETMVAKAQADLTAAQALNAEGVVVDEDTAVVFTTAVDALVAYSEAAKLLPKTNRLLTTAQGYISVADVLVAQSSDYQSIADKAEALVTGAQSENGKVVSFEAALALLVAQADDVKAQYDIEVASARINATTLVDAATVSETAATQAQGDSTSALSSADVSITSGEDAAAALVLAETAVAEASEFETAVNAFATAVEQASIAVDAYAGVAESDEDKAQAATLQATVAEFDSAALSDAATSHFAQAQEFKTAAEDAIVKFATLASVMTTTESVTDITVFTNTGTESIEDAADVLIDVINEIADLGEDAKGTSTRHDQWSYDYSVDELRFSLTNETTDEMIIANASYEGDKLVIAWGAELVAESGAKVEFTTLEAAAALTECTAFDTSAMVGSCLVLSYEADVTADNIDDAQLVMAQSFNNVVITDGDSGFTGTLSYSNDEVEKLESITLDGMSGDVDFTVMSSFDYSDAEAETDKIEIMVDTVAGESAMGYHFSVMRTGSDDFVGSISADYKDSTMVFGTVTEITNGISVTYIDDTTLEYTDVAIVDKAK